MSPLDTNVWGADVWRATAFILDATGAPIATGAAAYEGADIPGIQDWTPNFPKARTIVGVAQGRVRDTLAMPPNTAMQGTLKSLYHSQALEAALSGVNITTVLNKSIIQRYTDRQGLEPTVTLMIQQLITHGDDGLPNWYTVLLPHCRIIPDAPPMNQNASQVTYEVIISPSQVSSWGIPYTMAANGCLTAAYDDFISVGLPNLVFFKGNGTLTTFNLPTTKPAGVATSSVMGLFNFTTGAPITTGLTLSTTAYTLATAPVTGTILAGLYEQ